MKLSQVALQLYTLRDHAKTAADLALTLRRVREIGYQAVQVSGIGPIPEEELTRMLQGEGLICCATHEPGEMILSQPEKVVARLEKLGCLYTAYPYPGGVDFGDAAQIEALARKLDAAGAVLARAGQTLCYHNHAIEMTRFGEATALDYLYQKTEPNHLQGEIDTYWIQAGGGDPAAWCRKLRNRLPLLHLKDYGYGVNDKPFFAEIGSGNLDWKGILDAAEASGCRWFIVEQDSCPGDPFDSVRKSFDYIKARLCET